MPDHLDPNTFGFLMPGGARWRGLPDGQSMKTHCPGVLGGSSPPAVELRAAVMAAIELEGSVLLMGERGVGKERIARFIHAGSKAGNLPFEEVDCSRSFEDELEGVLLRLEQGSAGGTCYLSRCEELSLRLQGRLADYLEGSFPIRLLLSSPRNLAAFTRAGLYSRRLFEGLSRSVITVPPLRRRMRDLGSLLDHQACEFEGSPGGREFSPEAFGALATFPWPGNYLQLEAALQGVLRAVKGTVELHDLPAGISGFWVGGAEAAEINRLRDHLGVEAGSPWLSCRLDSEPGAIESPHRNSGS
ncbi:MAG: sigma 54-interacting transcriptional regulator [Planctomycetota bacterium]|nr:sigma 54-interacting transcriptional regulator [Planctomycetota bacterium]